MNKILYFALFAAGAVIGSAVTWKVVKTKYEQIAQEEIDSVKDLYSKKIDEHSNEINELQKISNALKNVDNKIKGASNDYEQLLETCDYKHSDEETIENKYEEVGKMPVIIEDDKPCVISPDEFGEYEEYELIFLTYYADGTVADYEDPIEDVDLMIGLENLNEMGKYEDDILHIRNDRHQCYYEITSDCRTFDEVWNSGD